MTNIEKAKEIAKDYCNGEKGYAVANDYTLVDAAMEMADWKDDKVRDLIKKQIDKANNYYDNNLSETQMYRALGAIDVLTELLDIEFPFHLLHMGFATMD